jgi:hypothetical protein
MRTVVDGAPSIPMSAGLALVVINGDVMGLDEIWVRAQFNVSQSLGTFGLTLSPMATVDGPYGMSEPG